LEKEKSNTAKLVPTLHFAVFAFIDYAEKKRKSRVN